MHYLIALPIQLHNNQSSLPYRMTWDLGFCHIKQFGFIKRRKSINRHYRAHATNAHMIFMMILCREAAVMLVRKGHRSDVMVKSMSASEASETVRAKIQYYL